ESFRCSGVSVGRFGYGHARNFSRAMVTDKLVQEGACKTSDNRTYQVNKKLAQVVGEFGVANDAFDDQRTDLTRWIECRAGDGTNQDDDPVDDESDDDPGEAGGCTTVDGRAEHSEYENCGADGF